MPPNSGDGHARSPEGRKSRFVGEERTSPSLQRGEHVEQITTPLPLLYVRGFASAAHVARDAKAEERVRTAIESLLTRPDTTGSFGLRGSDDLWLNSYVSDFLTRAREQKIAGT
jgi:hypothetical protein